MIDCKNLEAAAIGVVTAASPASSASPTSKPTKKPTEKPANKPTQKPPSKPTHKQSSSSSTSSSSQADPAATSSPLPPTSNDNTVTILANHDNSGAAYVFGNGVNLIVAVEVWEVKPPGPNKWATTVPVPTTTPAYGIDADVPTGSTPGPFNPRVEITFDGSSKMQGCVTAFVRNLGGLASPQPGTFPHPIQTPASLFYCPNPGHETNPPPGYSGNQSFVATAFALFQQQYYTHDPKNLSFTFGEQIVDFQHLNYEFDNHSNLMAVYGAIDLKNATFNVTRRTKI